MATNTTAVAKQVRLQQWAQQITDCQNRPVGMKVIDWCDANGIILPKLTRRCEFFSVNSDLL